MTTYEAVIILDDRKLDDHGEAFSREMAKYIKTLGGAVTKRESMGRKHFARPIGKHRAGAYWNFVIEMAPDKVAVLKERYRLNPALLRIEIFIYQEHAESSRQQRDF